MTVKTFSRRALVTFDSYKGIPMTVITKAHVGPSATSTESMNQQRNNCGASHPHGPPSAAVFQLGEITSDRTARQHACKLVVLSVCKLYMKF